MIKSFYTVFILFILLPGSSIAQFMYLDVGLSQSKLKLNKIGVFGKQTKLNTTGLQVGGLWRFNRFLGVGIDVGIPIAQKSTFTFYGSKTDPFSPAFSDFNKGYSSSRYWVYDLDYSLKQSVKLGLVGRVFFAGTSNLFVDLKFSTLKIKESLILNRMAKAAIVDYNYYDESRPAVEGLAINEKKEELSIIPGFAIGWQPHLGERFFMNMNLGFDFYIFKKNPSFSYVIPYDYDSYQKREYHVNIASQAVGTKLVFSGNLRFGMFF